MQQKRYKRTRYIVEKRLQLRFVRVLLLYLFAFFFISVLVIYFSGWRQLVAKVAGVYPQAMFIEILNTIYLRLWIGFLLLLPLAVVSAILVSHKVAGPLVRIKRALQQLIDGDYSVGISLRKDDELKDVAVQINELAALLKKRHVR